MNTSSDTPEPAALLLYINRHAFNGLVRYNSKGYFNVPFGKYKQPYFPLGEMRAFQRKTQFTKTASRAADFRAVFSRLEPGDVIYCEPPYVPLSATASFTAYAGFVFDSRDQTNLAALVAETRQKGITVVLSNHDIAMTKRSYSTAVLSCFSAPRRISCDGGNQGRHPNCLPCTGNKMQALSKRTHQLYAMLRQTLHSADSAPRERGVRCPSPGNISTSFSAWSSL